MKKIVLLAVLFLASCIPVDDFGSYFEQAKLDPELKGVWLNVDSSEWKRPPPESVGIVEAEGYYYPVDPPSKKPTNYATDRFRTLKIGDYNFLLIGHARRGSLLRYQIHDNKLYINFLSPDVMEYVKDNFPDETNFYPDPTNFMKTEAGEGKHVVRIRKLDEGVVKILSSIPDTEKFWGKSLIYEKVP